MMVAPKLRFKADDGSEFPAWEKKTLGDIVERVTRKNRDNQTDVPLTISSLDGLVDQRDYFKKTVASKDMSGYFLLQNGEFAYNKSYSVGFDYGSIKRLDKCPCGALSTLYICFGLKPNVDIDSDYLTHYFDSQKWNSEVAAICAEGARNHGLLNVSTSDFFDINIMSPSFSEQRKIADFLSAVDDVIATQQAEVDAWEQRKKGVMQKLFSQEVRFKADDGSDFPKWEEKTLGEYCTQLKASIDPRKSPNTIFAEYSMPAFDESRKARFVSGREMNSARKILSEPCVLVNKLNVRKRRIWLVKNPEQNAVCSSEFVPLSSNAINLTFLSYFALTDRFTSYLMDCSSGSSNSQKRVVPDVILNYVMQILSLPEQRKIADCLASMDEVIQKSKDELAKWQELKKGLLQQMFV